MAQQINDTFQLLAALPIDDRNRKLTIAERDGIPSTRRYQGLLSFVQQTQTLYMLIGGIANSNWIGIAGENISDNIETVIEGFYVLSAGKETLLDWELGDKFRGWVGSRYVVGEILSLPVSLPSDIDDTDKVRLAIDSDDIPNEYANIVYVNDADPNDATIFDLNNPPTVNDDALKDDVSNLYIGTDSSTWVFDESSSDYVTKLIHTNGSNFYLYGTTIDASGNKTAAIERSGNVILSGGLKITGGNPTVTTTPHLTTTEADGQQSKITHDDVLKPVYNTRVEVEYPDIFTFRPFSIFEKNGRYYTDFKVSSLVNDKISKMLPYYVNFSTGNNSNDGKTTATAFKTISYAYGVGARLIYLSKGVHLSSWGDINSSFVNTDDFFVIGASDGTSIVTNAPATFPTFSLVSGTAYSATVTSNTLAVDLKYTDSYGFPLKLKEVFTQAECIAEVGTFYKNANVITINLKDGRVPDSNVLIPASTANADYSANAGYNYVKDITFIGGGFSTGSHGSDSQVGSNSTMVSLNDNCKFLYAQSSDYTGNGGEGSRHRYNKLTMFENCVSYGNSRDGFNYVGDYDNPMGIVEINCQAFNNGLRGASESVNGSSAHQGAFPLRLNCKYYNNYGPNVADQGGTITYNVGVECFNSAVPLIGAPNIDFNLQPLPGRIGYMYNRGCTSYGSTQSFRISETTEAHMFNVGNHYGGIASVKTPEAPQTITFSDSFASANVPAYTFPPLSSYAANTGYLPVKTTYGAGGESIDALTSEGVYQISTSSTGVKPFTPRVFCVLRGVGSTFITQVAYGSGNSRVAVRSSSNSGSVWSDWVESAPNILTGYVSGAGTVAGTDTVLQAIQKLNGNTALKADISALPTSGSYTPTFSNLVNLPTPTVNYCRYVRVGNVTTVYLYLNIVPSTVAACNFDFTLPNTATVFATGSGAISYSTTLTGSLSVVPSGSLTTGRAILVPTSTNTWNVNIVASYLN